MASIEPQSPPIPLQSDSDACAAVVEAAGWRCNNCYQRANGVWVVNFIRYLKRGSLTYAEYQHSHCGEGPTMLRAWNAAITALNDGKVIRDPSITGVMPSDLPAVTVADPFAVDQPADPFAL